jgi:hypothetical protein
MSCILSISMPDTRMCAGTEFSWLDLNRLHLFSYALGWWRSGIAFPSHGKGPGFKRAFLFKQKTTECQKCSAFLSTVKNKMFLMNAVCFPSGANLGFSVGKSEKLLKVPASPLFISKKVTEQISKHIYSKETIHELC